MKHLLMSAAVAAVAMTANAAQIDLPIDNDYDLGSGWDSSYNGATHTITFEGDWTGRGWWLGTAPGADYSDYEEIAISIEPTDFYVQIVCQYNDAPEDSNSETQGFENGEAVLKLNPEYKNNVMQIYIQSSKAGEVVLKSAAVRNSEPAAASIVLFEGEKALDWYPGLELDKNAIINMGAGSKMVTDLNFSGDGYSYKYGIAWTGDVLPSFKNMEGFQPEWNTIWTSQSQLSYTFTEEDIAALVADGDSYLRLSGDGATVTKVTLYAPAGSGDEGDLIYFYDFEDGLNGAEIIGGGEIQDWGANFGKVFKNAVGGYRQNYLKLPSDVFSKIGDKKAFSISVFLNASDAVDYGWAPLFTAYDQKVANPENGDFSCPEFACQYRGQVQVNCNGNDNVGDAWCDYGDDLCDQGKVTLRHWETDWLADKEWHHYAAVFTDTRAFVYMDGELVNSWTLDGVSRGQRCEFFGDARFDLFCLGGMQAWNWRDNDPGFAFDDLGLYKKALTADDIKAIIADKGTLTGVESVATVVEGDDAWYNLQGVKVANPQHGIFIRNGKKIVIK